MERDIYPSIKCREYLLLQVFLETAFETHNWIVLCSTGIVDHAETFSQNNLVATLPPIMVGFIFRMSRCLVVATGQELSLATTHIERDPVC